jgi:hypothetical protein
MKVRTGFVSNSSSSSFCLVGVCFDSFDDLLAQASDSLKQELKDRGMPVPDDYDSDYEYDDAIDDWSPCTELRAITGLESFGFWDEQPIYIGKFFTDIDDDETPRQFRAKVTGELLANFKHEFCVQVHEGIVDQ